MVAEIQVQERPLENQQWRDRSGHPLVTIPSTPMTAPVDQRREIVNQQQSMTELLRRRRMSEIVEITSRGFERVEFSDHNGVRCSIQQSSAIDLEQDGGLDNPGSTMLWLGCNEANPKYFVPYGDPAWRPVEMPENYIADTRMHLNRAQVEMLVRQLSAWLSTGSFE